MSGVLVVVSAVVMAQTFQGDKKMAVKGAAALDLTSHVDGAGDHQLAEVPVRVVGLSRR